MRSSTLSNLIGSAWISLLIGILTKNTSKNLKKLQKIGLKNLSEVILNYIQTNRSSQVNHLLNSLNQKLSKLLFDNFSVQRYKNFNFYSSQLIKIVPRVSKVVSLVGWVLPKLQLQNLILSASNLEELRLIKCTLTESKFKTAIGWAFNRNFDMKLNSKVKLKLKVFSFIECGKEKYSNWKGFPERLERILEGVSKCGLTQTLRKIELLDNGVRADAIQKMISEYYWNEGRRIMFEVYDEEYYCFCKLYP